MSLFGDLPSAKNEPSPVVSSLSSSLKESSIAPPPSILRNKKRKAADEAAVQNSVPGPPGIGAPRPLMWIPNIFGRKVN